MERHYTVLKKITLYLLLACVVAWLVISYVPALASRMPTLAYPAAWHGALGWLGALTVLIFLAIQVWLVGSTWHSLRRGESTPQWETRRRRNLSDAPTTDAGTAATHTAETAHLEDSSPARSFRLNLAGEVFWTALPILMTLGVAFVGYTIWMGL